MSAASAGWSRSCCWTDLPLQWWLTILLSVSFVCLLFSSTAASFFGFAGAASALIFSNLGAAYGTAKAGVGVASMGVMKPELVMRSIIPVVMAGVLGIYVRFVFP